MTPLPPRGTTLIAPSDEGFVAHDDVTFEAWSDAMESIDQATLDELDRDRDDTWVRPSGRTSRDAS